MNIEEEMMFIPEPKPDEGRLLTSEEIDKLPKPIALGAGCYDLNPLVDGMKIAQDAKSSSMYQQRMKEVTDEIENYYAFKEMLYKDITRTAWWQSLKDKFVK